MPMLDAYIPEGALSSADEEALLARLTDILLTWEGADPTNAVARSLAWVFLYRPAAVYVAGLPATAPHYRFVATVPEGQLDDARRAGMVAAVTHAVAEVDIGCDTAARTWVFTTEVPDGNWGARGEIFTLARIAGTVMGDEAAGAAHAERRLRESRGRARDQVAVAALRTAT